MQGAQQAIENAACKPEVIILQGNFYQEEGRRVFAEHIRKAGTFPDAVFAFNDAMAFGVLDALRDAGRQVPEETQVIGFDSTKMAESFGLSSISVPMRKIGEESVRLAAERISDKDAEPITLTLETKLVSRKTTKKLLIYNNEAKKKRTPLRTSGKKNSAGAKRIAGKPKRGGRPDRRPASAKWGMIFTTGRKPKICAHTSMRSAWLLKRMEESTRIGECPLLCMWYFMAHHRNVYLLFTSIIRKHQESSEKGINENFSLCPIKQGLIG
jgi:hypothetical protein